jgi:hypothetical protein
MPPRPTTAIASSALLSETRRPHWRGPRHIAESAPIRPVDLTVIEFPICSGVLRGLLRQHELVAS